MSTAEQADSAGTDPTVPRLGSVVPFPTYPGNLGVFGAIAGVALADIWTLVVMFAYPKRLGDASQPHVWEVEEGVAPTPAHY